MTMSAQLNVNEAKTHLSKYLELVEKGETVKLCRRNVPIAEIRPIAKPKKPRPLGLCKGLFEVGPEFFEPLDADMMAAFNGEKD